jgi:hypothetical protein
VRETELFAHSDIRKALNFTLVILFEDFLPADVVDYNVSVKAEVFPVRLAVLLPHAV